MKISIRPLTEIIQIEMKMEKLKEERKLLSPGITDKDKIEANTKINCMQQKLDLVNHILEEFVAIDNKYTENENQRFIQKMQLMNTNQMPSLQMPCDK